MRRSHKNHDAFVMMEIQRMIDLKQDVKDLEGKEVVFTEIHGMKRIHFKGILREVYDNVAIIALDPELYSYETYSFSYYHILLVEGKLREWDRAADPAIVMKTVTA